MIGSDLGGMIATYRDGIIALTVLVLLDICFLWRDIGR